MNKRGLGRGLGALIPESDEIVTGNVNKVIDPTMNHAIVELKVTEVEANDKQPRRVFNTEELQSLADSIKEHGVVQPIIVRKIENGFQIVAGERRWRASRLAGLKAIPAIIKDYSNVQVMEIALIENLQREDLNPIEEAMAYRSLIDEYSLTQEDISKRIGKSRPAIANSLRLINLQEPIKQMLIEGKITAGHARALLAVEDPKKQLEIAELIIKHDLNVRDTERLANQIKTEKPKKEKNVQIIELEDRLKRILGTKVNIVDKKAKGKIEIEYYSYDELERIMEFLEN